MDWNLTILIFLLVTITFGVNGIRISPFISYSDANFEPIADYSINQGAYMASYYPMMNDDFSNFNGFSALKPQMVPFVNQFSPALPQISLPPGVSNQKKTKNNGQTPNKSSSVPQAAQSKNRGVTLDIRGGGYKMERPGAKPYRAPVAESSVQNPQKVHSGRPNTKKPNNNPQRNRKPNKRPNGPSIKNPFYNGKFESSLASIPPNVEFVNSKNVLPFHPSIYKPFLQQNKQFATQFQTSNRQKSQTRPKPPQRKPNSSNLSSYQSSLFNQGKPPSKYNSNRGNPFTSPITASQSFSSNFQTQNSQFPSLPSSSSQYGFFQGQANEFYQNKPLYSADLLNQDPSFYSMLSQTPEGRAVLSQMQHQQQMSSQPIQNSQRNPSFSAKPSQNFMKTPFSSHSSSTFSTGMESTNPTGYQLPQSTNFESGSFTKNQKVPNPASGYQQMMMFYNQHQQSSLPLKSASSSAASYHSTNKDNVSVKPQPHQQQYSNDQINSPYPEMQQAQNIPYHGSMPQGTYSHAYANTNPPYEDINYSNSFQVNQKQASNQASHIQNNDQVDFTLPPFSPADPLASADDNSDLRDYYAFQQTVASLKPNVYSNDESLPSSTHLGSSAIREISPYATEEKKVTKYEVEVQKEDSKSHTSGYMTPEQLFAPQTTGLQSDVKYGYPPSQSDTSSISQESVENDRSKFHHDDQKEGERAALHLPDEVSIYVAKQTENPYVYEYTEAYDPFNMDGSEKLDVEHQSSKETEVIKIHEEPDTDEDYQERVKELHKLLTKAPKNNYLVNPTEPVSVRTTPAPDHKKDSESGEMKNHKNTYSYVYQYSPSEKQKSSTTWHSRKPNVSRYHLPVPDAKQQLTTEASVPIYTTTESATTQTTTAPSTTESATGTELSSSTMLYYQDSSVTPLCARYNNLTYCLQDPEYPKKQIKEAIERNRHPLDHFLVDISASSNMVDDSLSKVFENSVPLQSTSVSYSFEGKAIAPTPSEISNSSGCSSNIYYAKPLRAINTAGQWKIIVNVEFEETGANYTQTVRIEECNYSYGFVATCGTETISACLQQYKLYRLLAWEPHRGFYIDAFLLPISCFCGSSHDTNQS